MYTSTSSLCGNEVIGQIEFICDMNCVKSSCINARPAFEHFFVNENLQIYCNKFCMHLSNYRQFYPSINTDDTRIPIASQIEFNICSFK